MTAATARPSPKVSAVLPTYNRAHLLPPVITSILTQNLRDLELIIVDDGSTDNTAAVVNEIRVQDPRMYYVSLAQNHGVGFARDVGLRYARGNYIALADSDDIWLPGRLWEQVAVLERYPDVDILFGDFWDINQASGAQHLVLKRSPGLSEVMVRQVEEDLFVVEKGIEIGILRSNFIATPTVILRREVFDRVGGFTTTLRACEDLEFWWRAAVLGARYAFINKPLIERHVHGDSLTVQGVTPLVQRIGALRRCRELSRSIGRADLFIPIRAAEIRTYRNLIWRYGEQKHRLKACRAYMDSLHCGISIRTLLVLIIASLGTRARRHAMRINLRQNPEIEAFVPKGSSAPGHDV